MTVPIDDNEAIRVETNSVSLENMKALILVGGFGTRLRPLTLSTPKPLIEFANKPMVIHQIEALKEAGVTEVVLAINYQPKVMMDFIAEWESKLQIKITVSREEEPMGTAGPIALARHILIDGSNEPFFVLNSDVICEYPLKDMLAFHKASGAEGTILVTKVEDPSKYGVVVMDGSGQIERFVEKPKDFVGDKINAGIYVLNPSVIDRIPLKPTSIEREIFPFIAQDKKLYAMPLDGYWMDVGQPRDYLSGLQLHLGALRKKCPAKLASGEDIVGNVLIDPAAKIGKGCKIGPDVSIGPECIVQDGARLKNCVLMSGVRVNTHARVSNSIVGWESRVGRWSTLDGNCVLGEAVDVADETCLYGAVVLPHKEMKESSFVEGKIYL